VDCFATRRDDHGNLALARHRCNVRKGPNLTGIDPITGDIVPLFDPRRDRWSDHFHLQGPVVEGVTAFGRTAAWPRGTGGKQAA
jgi:hypothetical protein